jgi:hypothetical protein
MNPTRKHWLTPYIDFTPASLCTIEGDGGAASGGTAVPGSNGAGGEAGAANVGGADPGAAAATGPNWGEFVNSLQGLNESLGGKLDTLVGEVRTASTPPVDTTPPDFEAMSRPELVAHIVGTVGEAVRAQLAAQLDPLHQQVTNLQTTIATGNAVKDRDMLVEKHKDFGEWKDDMIALAREHPTLALPALYTLARGSNPTKAATLDAKYNPPAPKPAPRWGGLTPTGGQVNGQPVLNSRDAGIEAYREVSAKYPGVLAALEGM